MATFARNPLIMHRRHYILLLTAYCFQCLAQITVAGKHVACDWGRGVLLTSVAESIYGTDYEAVVNYDESITSLTIDGEPIERDQPFTFRQVGGDAAYPLVAQFADGSTRQGQLQFTTLPVMEFSGVLSKDEYVYVTVTLTQPDNVDFVSLAKAKYRGSLTNSSTYSKRGIHLKFVYSDSTKRDVKLFGLRNDNNWILDGGANDVFRMRNRVACDLWNDMAVKPYYAAQEPAALSASRGQMIELFRDGGYKGIYNMCEAIDRKQMRLMKTDDNGTLHGLLWKAANRSRVTLMDTVRPYNNKRSTWDYFESKYPDFDDGGIANYEPLYRLVRLCSEADDSTFSADIANVIDLPVVIDYYIFLQALLAFDNQGKNIYWACYDHTRDKKVTLAVWDLDAVWGQDWKTSNMHPSYLHPRVNLMNMMNHHRFLVRLLNLNTDNFIDRVRERYRELRSTELDTEKLSQRFHHYYDMLLACGAIRREEIRSAESNIFNIPVDFATELAYIDDWIERRMRFLDCRIFAIVPPPVGDINEDDVVDVGDVNLLIDIVLGRVIGNESGGDLNGDGVIDVGDVNALINIVLGKTTP